MPIEFPLLENSTYLNTAYVGLMSKDLMEFRAEEESTYLHIGDQYLTAANKKLPQYHQNLGHFLGADPQYCYFVSNFSEGIRHIFNLLPKHFKLLSFAGDYHSLATALDEFDFSCTKVSLGLQAEDHLWEALNTEKFDVLVLSVVQYISGLKIDLDFLNRVKEHFPDLLIIGDATQFLGTAPFRFNSSPFDAIVGSGYKWLLAGFGNGYCAFNSRFFDRTQSDFKALGDRIYAGHFDILSAASLDFAIRQLQPEEANRRYAEIESLSGLFHQVLVEHEWFLDPALADRKPSSIFLLKGDQKIYDALHEQNIRCALRGDGIRISVHFYNTPNDLDHLVEVLKKIPQPQIAT